ncbi:MAG: DNA-binding protein [Candidatus Omnitrophica bacterium]|nr:DNA-binding protein [Candidatus Omnitrophota bacterium]
MRIFIPPIKSFIFILLILGVTTTANAEVISSTELIENARKYDKKTIEYQGEVVGDVMARGDFAWVNLHDGKKAIGAYGRRSPIYNLVRYKGGYNYKGDILQVKGVFHRACRQHGGDLDIHVVNFIKVREGFRVLHPIKQEEVVGAMGLFIVAAGFAILCAIRAKRK